MIPMPITAAHAAVLAWRTQSMLPEHSLAGLEDEDLAELRRVVVGLYDEVRAALDLIDTTLSGRTMARSPRSGPRDAGKSPGPDAPPGQPETTAAPAAPGVSQ